MPARRVLFLCAVSATWLLLAIAREDLVIVCPDDYSPGPSPREDCVPLHQLLSTLHLIGSNTTIQLLPALFKLGPDLSISIANVSNITVGAAGPHRATISCSGSNSGFVFKNMSGLTVQNMNITNCVSFSRNSFGVSKHSVEIQDCTNVTLRDVKFTASGVYAEDICGDFITSNALFAEMVDSAGYRLNSFRQSCPHKLSITISDSEILNSRWAAMVVYLAQISRLNLSDVTVRNNVVDSSVLIFSAVVEHVNITFERVRFEDNKLLNASTMYSSGIHVGVYNGGTTNIVIKDCLFSNNEIDVMQLIEGASKVFIINTVFTSNRGSAVQAGIFSQEFSHVAVIYNSTFSNNTSTDWDSIVYFSMNGLKDIFLQDCTFSNNRGTSLMLENSQAEFWGTNLFLNNSAHSGAAIFLESSFIGSHEDNATLYIQGNVAERFGGGIYVKKVSDRSSESCFLQISPNKSAAVYFDNNVAHLAGNDIYGGNLYYCSSSRLKFFSLSLTHFHSPPGYKIDVSSPQTRVCECSEQSTETCIHPTKVIDTVETYPGKKFNLSLLAVGQVFNLTLLSGNPSAVYAYILQQMSATEFRSGSIPSGMLVQKTPRTCSNLTYSINSTGEDEIVALSAKDLSQIEVTQYWLSYPDETQIMENYNNKYSSVPAYIRIHLLPCPAGFNLSLDGACVCSNALRAFDVECIIDTLMIHKNSRYFWLAINTSLYFSGKVLAHKHCPFDYCKLDVLDFSLADIDALCAHNRSGILCGACRSGYSLILGGTECRQCSNIYLLFLLPFALAGILLVVFLSLTDMTVAAGTVNGLLFYANIVTDNKATFFPPGAEDSFLSVFVQWLSLDLGIKSCFFDGLDAYTFTWLQLVFPIYVFLLIFTIIIASRYNTWMNRLCGTNIVQVLATLLLLSYTKLQSTIASALSFTVVEVSDGEKLFVWLKDGNLPYLQGKHIALFLVSLLLLCVFSLYTLSIALGPWLQRKTQYKVFSWVLKLKPLFDAYFGPLKNQYRYWTGLLLLSRTVLYLVSSVNVFGDDSVNLLAITVFCIFLIWQSHCVYKHKILSALDSFYLINLCILAVVSIYNKLTSGGSQTATIYASSGSAFVVFCVTLLYHCFSRLKNVVSERRHTTAVARDENFVENSDEEMLSIVDSDRK